MDSCKGRSKKKGNNTKKLNMIIDLDHLAERGTVKGEMNTMTNLYKKRCVPNLYPEKKEIPRMKCCVTFLTLRGVARNIFEKHQVGT